MNKQLATTSRILVFAVILFLIVSGTAYGWIAHGTGVAEKLQALNIPFLSTLKNLDQEPDQTEVVESRPQSSTQQSEEAPQSFDVYQDLVLNGYINELRPTSLLTRAEIEALLLRNSLPPSTSTSTISFAELSGLDLTNLTNDSILKYQASTGTWVVATDAVGDDEDTTYSAGNGLTLDDTTFSLGGTLGSDLSFVTEGYNTLFGGSGKIGIGTTSPTAFLDIPGSSASVASARIRTGVQPSSADIGDLYSDGTDLFFYNGSGWDDLTNVGGASSIADDSLDFTKLADALTLDATTSINTYTGTSDANFRIYNSDSSDESLFIDGSTGNVGIGTDSPNNLLAVQGLIDFNDSLLSTSLGYQAGNSNSATGSTFVGYQAGFSNTTAYQNTFLGTYAGYSTTTGTRNTFLGYNAGFANTTGQRSVFVGRDAGSSNTTGGDNLFIGYAAGNLSTTGFRNVFLGYRAGDFNTTGALNTFVGDNAGDLNTTGGGNVFIGVEAGRNNVLGNENVAIGLLAGASSLGSGNIYLGTYAGYYETGSNKLYIDNSNTSTPLIWGDFAADLVTINGKLGIGTTSPSTLLSLGNTSYTFAASGLSFGDGDTGMYESADDKLNVRTGGTDRVTVDASGNVGIGTSSPSLALDVATDAGFSGNVHILNGGTSGSWIYGSQGSYAGGARGRIGFKNTGLVLGDTSEAWYVSGSSLMSGDSNSSREVYDSAKFIVLAANQRVLHLGKNANDGNDFFTIDASSSYLDQSENLLTYRGEANFLDGNVGIGTTSPATPLEVNGNVKAGKLLLDYYGGSSAEWGLRSAASISIGSPASVNHRSQIVFGYPGNYGGAAFGAIATDNTAYKKFDFVWALRNGTTDTAAAEVLRLTSAGSLGIGTTSPSTLLSLGNTSYTFAASGLSFGDGDTGLYESADDKLNLRTAGSDRVTVDSSGNVGIGSISPTYKLQLNSGSFAINNSDSTTSQTNFNANLRIDNTDTTDGAYSRIGFYGESQYIAGISATKTADYYGSLLFQTRDGQSSWPDTWLTITSSGTLSSMGNLSVRGGATFNNYNVSNWNGTGNPIRAVFGGYTTNGGATPSSGEPILALLREGVGGQSWANAADFSLRRWEHNGLDSRTALDIGLLHGSTDTTTAKVLTLLSSGNVGIGTTNPSSFKLQVAGDIGPNADSTYDLGSSSLAWNEVFADTFTQNGNEVCDSSGNCGGAGLWQLNSGAISPNISSYDVLVGSTATGSATVRLPGTANGNTIFNSGGAVGINTTNPTAGTGDTDLAIYDTDYTRLYLRATDPATDVEAIFDARGDGTNTVQLGSISAHPLSFYTGSQRRALIDTSGNLRLNNSMSNLNSASGNLDIEDSDATIVLDALGTPTGRMGIEFWEGSAAMSLSYDGSGSGDANALNIRDEVNNLDRLTVQLGGNVGIGTTNPATLLHASGSNVANGSGGMMRIMSTDTATQNYGGSIALGGNYTGTTQQVFAEIAGRKESASGTQRGYLAFSTTASTPTERMRIDSNGDVGIGTTSPDYKLHVEGITKIGSGDTQGRLLIGSLTQGSNGDITIAEGGSITGSNRLNMGYDNSGNYGYFDLYNSTDNPNYYFRIEGSDKMTLTSGGNVGIGTTSPQGALHVVNTNVLGSDTTVFGVGYNYGSRLQSTLTSAPGTSFYGGATTSLLYNPGSNPGTKSINSAVIIAETPSANSTALTTAGLNSLTINTDHNGTGTLGTLAGTTSYIRNASTANVTNAYGSNTSFTNYSTGTVTTATLSSIRLFNSGTITNTYGYYVGDITAGTQTNTPYSFYASDAGTYSYFAGSVGIGDTTPDAPLDVVGDLYVSDGISLYETAVSDGTIEATKFCTGDGETNCVTDFSALGGATTLAALTDTDVSSPSGGQVLVYDGTDSWNNVYLTNDILVSTTGAVTIQPNAVAMGFDTTGNYVASINAGNGLASTGATTGENISHTLSINTGNGIQLVSDAVALGALTADWNQTGAFDIILNNADSQLQILESAGATYYGTLDVGDLSANATYTLAGASGTIWTSGNDGSGSTLDADTLDGIDSAAFLRSDTSDSYTSGTLTFNSGTTVDINGDLSVADTSIAFDGASTNFNFTGDASFNTSNLFIEKSTGNIGIGTTSPEGTLHVSSTNVFGSDTTVFGAGYDYGSRLQSTITSAPATSFYGGATTSLLYNPGSNPGTKSINSAVIIAETPSANSTALTTAGLNSLTINTDHNGTGTLGTLAGTTSYIRNASTANVTNAYGSNTSFTNYSTGTVTTATLSSMRSY